LVIFDTNLLIDALRGEKKAIDSIESYRDKESAAITVLNKYELLRGRKFLEQHTIDKLIDNLNLYGLENGGIEASVEIYRALKTKGRLIDELDIIIAGITVANNEKLVTSDKDFKEIRKLGYNNFIVIE
jgi:predicted nucleic acid-binding protein